MEGSDPPAKRAPLSYRTVSEAPWIDQPAAVRIYHAVALPLCAGTALDGLRAALDHAALDTMLLAFGRDPRGRRQDIKRLAGHFRGYQDLAWSLPGHHLFPPKMPPDWVAAVERWFANLEPWIQDPSPGGRPRDLLGAHLVPRLLALFFAAYGERPTTSTARGTGHDGPAARLILAVIAEVHAVQDRIGFDGTIYDEARRKQLEWQVPNPSALEKMISRALQRPARVSAEDGGRPTSCTFEYEVRAEYYAVRYLGLRGA